jgi:hypothetical protein
MAHGGGWQADFDARHLQGHGLAWLWLWSRPNGLSAVSSSVSQPAPPQPTPLAICHTCCCLAFALCLARDGVRVREAGAPAVRPSAYSPVFGLRSRSSALRFCFCFAFCLWFVASVASWSSGLWLRCRADPLSRRLAAPRLAALRGTGHWLSAG